MRHCYLLIFLGFIANSSFCNLHKTFSVPPDTVFARKVIAALCKPEFNGRGYFADGAVKSGRYIASEMKAAGLKSPKGAKKYQQSYSFEVNAINQAELVFNGKKLIPGRDFLFPADMETDSGKVTDVAVISEKTLLDTVWFKSLIGELSRKWAHETFTDFILIDTLSPTTEKRFKKEIDLIIERFRTLQLKKKLTYTVATNKAFWKHIQILHSSVAGLWEDKSGIIISYRCVSSFGLTKQTNVIGMVKGKVRPDSFLVVCAHYDHLGRMGSAVFPGANDNAAGVAMMLDLARHYAKNPHRYSIIFIAFSGEEAGLLGSYHYVKHAVHNLKKTRFVMNLDLVGTGETGMTVVNATAFPKDFTLLETLNKNGKYLLEIRKRGKAANSDHYFFTELGIPSFFCYQSGPRGAYHDVDDVPETLSLAGYAGTFRLIDEFFKKLP